MTAIPAFSGFFAFTRKAALLLATNNSELGTEFKKGR